MLVERITGNLGEILLRDGLITNSQLDEAIKKQHQSGQPLGKILVELGYISESDKLNTYKKRLGCEIISLGDIDIPLTILTYIPKSFASKHFLVPVRLDRDGLVIAMEDPTDIVTVDNLKTLVGIRIKPAAAPSSEIEKLIQQMPDITEPLIHIAPQRSFLYRAIKYSAFPVLCFLPIPGFILAVKHFNFLFNFFTKAQKFDIFLYVLIGWGFWAIILYEINGLIFGEPTKPKPPKKEDEF